MVSGVEQYADDVEVDEEVVLVTTKGEAIAVGLAQMTTTDLTTSDNGAVVKTTRVIMKPGAYPKKWDSSRTEETEGTTETGFASVVAEVGMDEGQEFTID